MATTSSSWTRRIGVSLMAAAIALATALAAVGPVAAEESSGTPKEAKDAKVSKHGFYDAPLSTIIPPSVLQSFPPQVVCLVIVKACTGDFHEDQPDGVDDGYNQLTGGVEQGINAAEKNDPGEPVSPVPPDTLPVAVTTGQPRYRSAIAFELPTVPSDHQVDSFKVYLTEKDPTGGVSSPMVRQAVLAAMTCARGCQQDQFEKILTMGCTEEQKGQPCPAEDDPLGVEMCPIADDPSTEDKNAEWKGERSQDPKTVPDTDCFLGANGRRLEDGTWEFDLTFALEAWSEGEIANNGVLLVPQGAPNFAFGDPDSTFNKQVSFEPAVKYTVATSEEVELFTPDLGGGGTDLPGSTSGGSGSFDSTGSTGSSGGFSTPSSSGTSGNVSSFSAPANDDPVAQPAPEVAGGDSAAAPNQQPVTEPVAAGTQEQPGSAWYVWLLAPVFLGGAWLTAQSLTAPTATALAGASKEGAMTRLLSQQAAASSSSGPQLA